MDIGDIKYLEQPAKALKLSEAMRLGAKLRPQNFSGSLFLNGRSCALGAAYEGKTGEICDQDDYQKVREEFPSLENRGLTYGLSSRIYELNDKERMPREVIANWLEKIGL